jgi:hypothetical protein
LLQVSHGLVDVVVSGLSHDFSVTVRLITSKILTFFKNEDGRPNKVWQATNLQWGEYEKKGMNNYAAGSGLSVGHVPTSVLLGLLGCLCCHAPCMSQYCVALCLVVTHLFQGENT